MYTLYGVLKAPGADDMRPRALAPAAVPAWSAAGAAAACPGGPAPVPGCLARCFLPRWPCTCTCLVCCCLHRHGSAICALGSLVEAGQLCSLQTTLPLQQHHLLLKLQRLSCLKGRHTPGKAMLSDMACPSRVQAPVMPCWHFEGVLRVAVAVTLT
jgi:hypothetical protein